MGGFGGGEEKNSPSCTLSGVRMGPEEVELAFRTDFTGTSFIISDPRS